MNIAVVNTIPGQIGGPSGVGGGAGGGGGAGCFSLDSLVRMMDYSF